MDPFLMLSAGLGSTKHLVSNILVSCTGSIYHEFIFWAQLARTSSGYHGDTKCFVLPTLALS